METARNNLIMFLIMLGKISLVVIIVLLPFSYISAVEVNNLAVDNNSDIFDNALKNNISFRNAGNNVGNFSGTQPTNILLPADIIKELQDITKKQNISLEKIYIATNDLKNRSLITTFLVGNNLGTLKFQLVQIEDQIYLLEALSPKTNDNKIQIQINNQAKSLKEEKTKVESFILEKDNKFSLFGWLVTSL